MTTFNRRESVNTRNNLHLRIPPPAICVDFVCDVLGDTLLRKWLKMGMTIPEGVYYIHLVHALTSMDPEGIDESFREMVHEAMSPMMKVPLCWMDQHSRQFIRLGLAERRKITFTGYSPFKHCPKRSIFYCHPVWHEEEIAERLAKVQQ